MLRLLTAALILLLPLPALAAPPPCQAPAAKAESQHRGHAPQSKGDERAAPGHNCVGCVPPRSCDDRPIAEPMMPLALSRRILAAYELDGRTVRPALPPPRPTA